MDIFNPNNIKGYLYVSGFRFIVIRNSRMQSDASGAAIKKLLAINQINFMFGLYGYFLCNL